MSLKICKACRICGGEVEYVLSLGDQRLASNFEISADYPPIERAIPLSLVRCVDGACGLLQLGETVPGNLMYSCYGYRSGVNQTMRNHLARIADEALSYVKLDGPTSILDIGANDGTLLASYPDGDTNLRFFGCEPSDVEPTALEGTTKSFQYVRHYFSAAAIEGVRGMWPLPKIITSIAMFYDLENPMQFVRDIAATLHPEGVWIFEMSYMPLMLQNLSYDTICHEHLEYYHLAPIEKMLTAAGLGIVDVSTNDANGGSLRVVAAHAGSSVKRTPEARLRIYKMQAAEFEARLDTREPYEDFAHAVEKSARDLHALIAGLREEGKTIYGYGASTKGNVILQYAQLGPDLITAIADRNPLKHGGKTVGTNIPIISEADMREAKPDYLLVLPWHFINEFMHREGEFLARGGKFIVPCPTPRVVE